MRLRMLAMYPPPSAPSAAEQMARLVGDVQFVCEARRLARLIERTKTPTYVYSYDYVIDSLAPDHVIHGVEANILFGNDYTTPAFTANHPLDASDLALHSAMAGYWTRFAKTGNPNSDDDRHRALAGVQAPDRRTGADPTNISFSILCVQGGHALARAAVRFPRAVLLPVHPRGRPGFGAVESRNASHAVLRPSEHLLAARRRPQHGAPLLRDALWDHLCDGSVAPTRAPRACRRERDRPARNRRLHRRSPPQQSRCPVDSGTGRKEKWATPSLQNRRRQAATNSPTRCRRHGVVSRS